MKVLFIITLFTNYAVFAGPLQNHQQRQGERIRQGVKSGALTKDEAKGLREEQKKIREERKQLHQDKMEARKDGVVTAEEKEKLKAAREQIKAEQKAASDHIYQEKHDAENRVNKALENKPEVPGLGH